MIFIVIIMNSPCSTAAPLFPFDLRLCLGVRNLSAVGRDVVMRCQGTTQQGPPTFRKQPLGNLVKFKKYQTQVMLPFISLDCY